MKKFYSAFLLAGILLLLNCAAHTNLAPVGKGKSTTYLSFGGPIIKAFGARIPIPYATIGSNYGLTESVNLHGDLHLLSLAYQVVGLELGTAWFPIQHEGLRPSVGIMPGFLALASVKSGVDDRFRLYPQLAGSAAWRSGKNKIYTGFNFLFPLSSADYDDEAAAAIFSPFVGYQWQVGSRTKLFFELKWNAATTRSDQVAVDYLPVAGHGAITPLFAIERSF